MKKIILLFGLIAAGSIALERSNYLPSGMSIFISCLCGIACLITITFVNHANGLKKKITAMPAKKEIIAKEETLVHHNPEISKELAKASVPHRGIFAS